MYKLAILSAIASLATCQGRLNPIYCPTTRPTEDQCPTIQYSAEPQKDICGIKFNGQKTPFDVECSACKDPQISYYYKASCQVIGINQNIPKQSSIEDQVLKKLHLLAISCLADYQCQNWEKCDKGKKICVDLCYTEEMKNLCRAGCRKGKCLEFDAPTNIRNAV